MKDKVHSTSTRAIAIAIVAVAAWGCGTAATVSPAITASPPDTTSPSALPSVAATATQADAPEPPIEFTGRIMCGTPVRSGPDETVEVGDEGMVLTRQRGGAFRHAMTMSDPRLEGTAYGTFEADYYAMPGAESGPQVAALTYRIENEAGAWEALGYGGSFADGSPIGAGGTGVWIGEGAYEGLIAIMESTNIEGACGDEVRGVIFDGAPVPQPYHPD